MGALRQPELARQRPIHAGGTSGSATKSSGRVADHPFPKSRAARRPNLDVEEANLRRFSSQVGRLVATCGLRSRVGDWARPRLTFATLPGRASFLEMSIAR